MFKPSIVILIFIVFACTVGGSSDPPGFWKQFYGWDDIQEQPAANTNLKTAQTQPKNNISKLEDIKTRNVQNKAPIDRVISLKIKQSIVKKFLTRNNIDQSGPKFNVTLALQCLIQGGRYERVGMLGLYKCVTYYSDGGKPCQKSADCQGKCLVRSPTQVKHECSINNSPFGCFVTIEDFNDGKPIICVD